MAEWLDEAPAPCPECGELDGHQRWCTVEDRAAGRLMADELHPDRAWGWWL